MVERCLDLCTYACSGCLIVPYDDKEAWSQHAMLQIQQFLSLNGFAIGDVVSNMHYYHLRDNPVLRSATIIVDRLLRHECEFMANPFQRTWSNLFTEALGKSLTTFVKMISSSDGVPDYDWEYGKEGFFSS